MNKLKGLKGEIIHLTRDWETFKRMKREGYDVELISKQMLDRKYPFTCKVTHQQFDQGGYQHSEPTFYSMEDEILWFRECTKNGKLIGIDYE